jgi:hypothetical protein
MAGAFGHARLLLRATEGKTHGQNLHPGSEHTDVTFRTDCSMPIMKTKLIFAKAGAGRACPPCGG